MKKVSNRAAAILVLLGIMLTGVVVFVGIYFVKSGDWIVFSGNPYTYTSGTMSAGRLTDRSGTLLLDCTGGRTYAEDAALRKATLHLFGDRDGYIAAPLLNHYASKLAGFNPIDGVYALTSAVPTAELTISAQAQTAALQALGSYSGTIGVYNYKTGEILCCVSTPTYDPDNVPDIAQDTTGQYDGVYVNRFFHATFTPGSIFKLVTAAAALEKLDDVQVREFTCEGKKIIDGSELICNNVHGNLDFSSALAKSCNIAFGELAIELGAKTLRDYADRFGLLDSFDVDGIATLPGQFDAVGTQDINVAWAGVGQSTDLINACSFLRFVGAIAGGGEAAEPYLVNKIQTGTQSTYQAKTKSTGKLMAGLTAQQLQQMMVHNVETVYGTEYFGALTVGAKSGTAEVGEGIKPNATFAGFVDDEQYPLAFIVIVQDAGSGSSVCTTMAASVLKACVAQMDQEVP